MICPYCDSRVREVPDNRCCPNCGAPMGVVRSLEVTEPPLGVYKQPFETLEIQEKGLRFRKKFLWLETDRFVPYEEVDRLCFVPGGKELGFLCVRERNERERPLLHTAKKASVILLLLLLAAILTRGIRESMCFCKLCAKGIDK